MKCCSRSTLGVVIGILNVLVYTASVLQSIEAIVLVASLTDESTDFVLIFYSILLVLYLTMIVISGLFIMGIVKRRHKLMLPLIILSGINFVMESVMIAYNCYINIHMLSLGELIEGLMEIGISALIFWLIFGLIGIVISALIILLIYNLYIDIRKDNISNPIGDLRPYYKT